MAMRNRTAHRDKLRASGVLIAAFLVFAPAHLRAQLALSVKGRELQIHGFLSQGYAYSNQNNYLTMQTSRGTAAFSDIGLNVSTQLTDKLRVGAQIYSRNVGQLGDWRPLLDYAYADYRLTNWFGIRGGRVKTQLGLYTSTQDADFLRPWALLPQSVYPADLRSITISHDGLDIYGSISLGAGGSLAYTAYAGARPTDKRSGAFYQLEDAGWNQPKMTASMTGADLRWNPPLPGLMLGVSQIIQKERVRLTGGVLPATPLQPDPIPLPPIEAVGGPYRTSAFYGDYERGKLHLSTEYRRIVRSMDLQGWPTGRYVRNLNEKAWFASASFRANKWMEVGTYSSLYYVDHPAALDLPGGPPPDSSLYHIMDQAATVRWDFSRSLNLKLEGHFIDGTGDPFSPHGFYARVNGSVPYATLKPTTTLLIIRMGWDF
jgi:hypothetical protein